MNWLWSNLDLVGELMLVHLALSVPAIILSFVVSVPIGWLAHRYRWSRGVLLSLCALLYAVPSLALFIALPAITGLSLRSPGEPRHRPHPLRHRGDRAHRGRRLRRRRARRAPVRDRGRLPAVGRFWGVELPLAGPVLLSGLRVVIVSTVSLATVGAVIGVQSLGSLFTDGFQRGIQAGDRHGHRRDDRARGRPRLAGRADRPPADAMVPTERRRPPPPWPGQQVDAA